MVARTNVKNSSNISKLEVHSYPNLCSRSTIVQSRVPEHVNRTGMVRYTRADNHPE